MTSGTHGGEQTPARQGILSQPLLQSKNTRIRAAGALLALCLLAGVMPLGAGSTSTWEINSFEEFLKGKFSGVSLSRDGRLLLAPLANTLFDTEQPVVWATATARDGSLYVATGHRGRLYRVTPDGKGTLLWTAGEPEIFALTLDARDNLFVATSPEGKIYRYANGRMEEYFAPGQTYIWALAAAPDGALYAGTGEGGKVYRITGPNQGELYYDTGQGHVTSLLVDREGRLLAGAEPNGLLYRISAKDKGFVLYDSNLPEMRSLAITPSGDIIAAALGGALAQRIQAASSAAAGAAQPATGAVMSVTVTADAQQGGLEIKPPAGAKPTTPASPPPAPLAFTEVSGVETSAIYRIRTDGAVETLFSSKEENVYDLALEGESILFSTDKMGRIFRLDSDRSLALMLQTNEGEVTRLVRAPAGLLAATGNMGKIIRLAEERNPKGEYESPVHDAGAVARWGRLHFRADACPDCKIAFRTRSGNAATPDKTWSEWSAAAVGAGSVPITSPNARYLQWKVEMEGAGNQTPVLDSVTAAYLPQNSRPVVTSVTASLQQSAKAPATAQASSATAAYSITVTDSGSTGAGTSAGTPTQKLVRQNNDEIRISWEAEDYDGDRLTYELYFRGEDEREWKLLKAELTEKTYVLDSYALADGKYFFKVVASDVSDNAAERALTAELISSTVLVDQSPPRVTLTTIERQADRLRLRVHATDASSMVKRCEYSLNAGPWQVLSAADGVADSLSEEFDFTVLSPQGAEKVLVVRCQDAAENYGAAKLVLR